MKIYEWIDAMIGILSLIISILSLLVTFYFSKQISKLTQKANEIAEKTYMLQQEQFSKKSQKNENILSENRLKPNGNVVLKRSVTYNENMLKDGKK